MSGYVHKSHDVIVLMYHIVCTVKFQRAVFSEEVDKELKKICQEIEKNIIFGSWKLGWIEIMYIFLCKIYQN